MAATEFAELRTTRLPVEARAAAGSRTIGGYAATFGSYSENLGGYVERVMPSFFNLAQADGWNGVVCRYNHDSLFVLGAARSGTLRLGVDATGLSYDVDVPESRNDILELVRRGDVSHSSFSFLTGEDDWGLSADGVPLRSLISANKLIDVAPVPVPAYKGTSVAMRSLSRHMSAPLKDVVALAESGQLRKLFVRSDRPPLSVAQARARIWRKRYGPAEPHGLHWSVALAHLEAKRWPSYMR